MTSWHTENSHENALANTAHSTRQLQPRKNRHLRATKSSKCHPYASVYGYPTNGTAHFSPEAYSQPCASDKINSNIDGNTGSIMAIISNRFAGQNAIGDTRNALGRYTVQKGGLWNLRSINKYFYWQDQKRLKRDFKAIPFGDGIHEQGSTPRSH